MDKQQGQSTADWLFGQMLDRIQTGAWAPGDSIPSERKLIAEFCVSRIALREALAQMRALGLLNIAHGKKTTVGRLDASILGRMFPLMLSFEGGQNYLHFLQLRICLEQTTAYSSALNRTPENLERLEELLRQFEAESGADSDGGRANIDFEFHIEVARACKNPLFPMLLEALSHFMMQYQIFSLKGDPIHLEMARYYHRAIFEAIRDQKADQARNQMEAHLRTSAGQVVKDGTWFNSTNEAARRAQNTAAPNPR
jgi:GntR family transcriptional regulator, transcriptional repressor for pyruvate dehydrogenase complex